MSSLQTTRPLAPGGMPSARAGLILVFLAGTLWSLQGLVIRQIGEAGSWAVLFWRSVGMIPVLTVFLAIRSRGAPLQSFRALGLPGFCGGLALVGAFGGAIYALQATTIANAVFLFAASPLLAAVIGRLVLGEPVPPRTVVAIAVALFGIAIMVGEGIAIGALAGSLAALVSALGFAVFTVTLRRGRGRDTLPTVLLGALFATAAGALAAGLAGEPLLVPWPDAVWAMILGAVTLTGGMVLYTLGSQSVPAAQSALLSNVEVVLSPVWVFLVYGEGASVNTFIGGAIILGALLLNGYLQSRAG